MAGFGDFTKGISNFGGGLSDYLVGKDGIGGNSGALGNIGDFFTGTNAIDPTYGNYGGQITPGSKATPGLFGNIGNYAQENPEMAKLGIQGLGGLGQYLIGQDTNRINKERYNSELDLSNRYFNDQVSRANAADEKVKTNEEAFNNTSGFNNPYSRYAR